MAASMPHENIKVLVQHAIFDLEQELENSLVKLDRLEQMISSARLFKESANARGNAWTHQMEEKLVSDIFRAQDLRRQQDAWVQDLARFQRQLDDVLAQMEQPDT